MSFTIIAAVGKNLELGKAGGLCFDIPGDLKFFKKITLGHPIFMGVNTWKSLPRKLPGREHFVLVYPETELPEDINPVYDLEEFIKLGQDSKQEMFVIGGGTVYKKMIEACDKLYLTEVEAVDAEADTFFPEFDKSKYTKQILGNGEDHGIAYTHVLYTKK